MILSKESEFSLGRTNEKKVWTFLSVSFYSFLALPFGPRLESRKEILNKINLARTKLVIPDPTYEYFISLLSLFEKIAFRPFVLKGLWIVEMLRVDE